MASCWHPLGLGDRWVQSNLGNLNLSFELFGGNVGAGVLTEELGVSAALFVGSSFLVSCWLLFALALLLTNELFSTIEVLALRFGLGLAPNTFDLSSFD